MSPIDEKDDVDSLPSDSTSDLYSEADSEAEAEWERSLEQLQLVLTMVLVPWMGKYFGRKFAYWSTYFYARELLEGGKAITDDEQAGHGTWSGCMTLKSAGRTKRHSRQLVLWRRQPYELPSL